MDGSRDRFAVNRKPSSNYVIQSTSDPIQEISVSDNNGKEIARISEISQTEYACDLNLAEGVYIVTVRTSEKVEVVRVIVIK